MGHPTVADIVAGTPAARAHVAACDACRRLAALARTDEDLDELPQVDPSLYAAREEMFDGGMGRTFTARDRRLGRVVALKQIRATDSGPLAARLRRRLEREARLTARLDHPTIVAVHEAGRWPDGEPFYAMRLVRGAPLEEAIAARKTLAERLALLPHLIAVAEALAYAHAQGVVHRDVKPQNILLGSFGETVLIDWGLAKDLLAPVDEAILSDTEVDDGLTRMGVGTAQYMPPEQATGAEPDPRFDVYALGATLYHALAASPPYGNGDPAEVRRRLADRPPRPLADLAPDAPGELQTIVAKAMARDPAARFQTAIELAEELRRFESGQLTRTHRHTLGDLVRHFARRYRASLRVAAVALVALVAGGVAAFARVVRERDRAAAAERRAEGELLRALGSTASLESTQTARRLSALEHGIAAVAPAARRGEPVAPEALQGLVDALAAGPAFRFLDAHGAGGRLVAITPDAARLATANNDRTVSIWDARAGRQLVRLPSIQRTNFSGAFSPDGKRIVGCQAEDLAETWSTAGTTRRLQHAAGDVVVVCDFMRDGRAVTASTALALWDAAGREVARVPLPAQASALLPLADGRVALGLVDDSVVVVDPATGARTPLARHRANPIALAVTPDGKHLLSASNDGELVISGLDGTAAPRVVVAEAYPGLRHIAVSPDGRWVALAGSNFNGVGWSRRIDLRGEAPVLDFADSQIVDWSTGSDRFLVTHAGSIPTWNDSLDGAELLRLDNPFGLRSAALMSRMRLAGDLFAESSDDGAAIGLWDARVGPATGLFVGHSAELTALATSGDRLLSASLDGTARIWDLATGGVATLRADAEVMSAAWDRAGTRVVAAGVDGSARLFPLDGKPAVRLAGDAPLTAVAFAPDGARVAVTATSGTVTLFAANGDAPPLALDAHAGAATALAFAPDGRSLAAGYSDGRARVWSLPEARVVATVEVARATGGVASIAFAPDGRSLLVGGTYEGARLVAWPDATAARDVEGRPASPASPFAADGRFATVTADGRVLVWDAAGARVRALRSGTAVVLATAFSPDGRRLAASDIVGATTVWSTDDAGAPPLVVRAATLGPATALAWSPRGDEVFVGYGRGALRGYPVTCERALARACGVLAALGDAIDGCAGASDTTEKSRHEKRER